METSFTGLIFLITYISQNLLVRIEVTMAFSSLSEIFMIINWCNSFSLGVKADKKDSLPPFSWWVETSHFKIPSTPSVSFHINITYSSYSFQKLRGVGGIPFQQAFFKKWLCLFIFSWKSLMPMKDFQKFPLTYISPQIRTLSLNHIFHSIHL